jgi:cell division protein FtsW (lipid II flippase)
MENQFQKDERYFAAQKRVKSIKGFYTHFTVYVFVNIFICIQIYLNSKNNFWRWESFSTALFWGIGILSHGTSVFGSNLLFGKNWEDRKIKEIMEKDKSQNTK